MVADVARIAHSSWQQQPSGKEFWEGRGTEACDWIPSWNGTESIGAAAFVTSRCDVMKSVTKYFGVNLNNIVIYVSQTLKE
jgi:hypothetical protein